MLSAAEKVNLYRQRFKTPLERFSASCRVVPSGCWEWTARVESRGAPFKPYGRFWFRGRTYPAHRAAWIMFRGDPGDMYVCHRCDNPRCVNVDHLFLGEPRVNTQDMITKGRRASTKGELHGQAKLTAEQVRKIRADSRFHSVIAKDFGVSQTMVSKIKRREAWTHVA